MLSSLVTFLRQDYATNMLFDDISEQFTGIGKTYTMTVGGGNNTQSEAEMHSVPECLPNTNYKQ